MALVYPASMPYDTVKIVDNSVYDESNVAVIDYVPTGPIAYIPFISPKGYGKDNKLVYLNLNSLRAYGEPNLKDYGLSLYLARRFAQGGGTVLGMRVVPDFVPKTADAAAHGASYANICVYATVTDNAITYGTQTVNYSELTEAEQDVVKNFDKATIDSTTVYKLFVIRAKAAGKFANNFTVNLAADENMNELYPNSFFYKLSGNTGDNKISPMSFTFRDRFIYEGESMDPENVVKTYSEQIVFERAGGWDSFVKAIGYAGEADILLAKDYTNAAGTKYTITNTAITETLSLGGAVDIWTEKFTWEKDPFAEALVMAYGNNGEEPVGGNASYTDLIFDQVRYPFQYMFAPSYDKDLVKAMHELVQLRDITHLHVIVPKAATYSAQRTLWNAEVNYTGLTDFREHIYANWAEANVEGTRMLLPAVYFNAYAFPKHWNERKGTPYAGERNFAWTDHVSNTVIPDSSAPANLIENHKVRFNSVIDYNGRAVPVEQITANSRTSDLSECNNSYILTDMIRIALNIANNKRWTDLSDAEIAEFKKDVTEAIANELRSCYSSVNVVTTREAVNGAGKNRIACSLTVRFKSMLKGVSYTFYISA